MHRQRIERGAPIDGPDGHVGQEKRALYETAKSMPCSDCGGTFPLVAMDLDHVRGDKVADVTKLVQMAVSLQDVRDEIAKCEAVCANCHRIRTAARPWRKKVQDDAD